MNFGLKVCSALVPPTPGATRDMWTALFESADPRIDGQFLDAKWIAMWTTFVKLKLRRFIVCAARQESKCGNTYSLIERLPSCLNRSNSEMAHVDFEVDLQKAVVVLKKVDGARRLIFLTRSCKGDFDQ